MSFLICEKCKNWFNTCRNTSNTNDRKCPFYGHYNNGIYISYSDSFVLKNNLTSYKTCSNIKSTFSN